MSKQGARSLLKTAETYFASPVHAMQHELSFKAIGLVSQRIGVLRMPCLSTGTAGTVFFTGEAHGIAAINLGFSFGVQPVLLLATHEVSDIDRDIATYRDHASGHSCRSNEEAPTVIKFPPWPSSLAFDVNSLRSQSGVQRHDDGSLEIGGGVYAFTPKVTDQPEHRVFKPYDDVPLHLLIGSETRRTEHYIFWKLAMDMREGKVAFQI